MEWWLQVEGTELEWAIGKMLYESMSVHDPASSDLHSGEASAARLNSMPLDASDAAGPSESPESSNAAHRPRGADAENSKGDQIDGVEKRTRRRRKSKISRNEDSDPEGVDSKPSNKGDDQINEFGGPRLTPNDAQAPSNQAKFGDLGGQNNLAAEDKSEGARGNARL